MDAYDQLCSMLSDLEYLMGSRLAIRIDSDRSCQVYEKVGRFRKEFGTMRQLRDWLAAEVKGTSEGTPNS